MLTGLDVLLEEGVPELRGRRAGLITNQTGIDRHLHNGIDQLLASDRLELVALFGPEHGLRGEVQAGDHVGSNTDPHTGLPVHSLYGETRSPTPAMLHGLEALLFDVQDAGARFYTNLSTLLRAQEAAAGADIPFAVLDRPNPITGTRIEGPLLDPAFASFVGAYPIPARHGMTFGELARLFAAERGWPDPLVVLLRGWRRDQWFDETRLPWVAPSVNMPTLDTATLYPGTCLVEATNLSEGRGTTRPFELIGAPWLDPFALTAELEARGLPGVRFRPMYTRPMFSKQAGETCGGVQVHVADREALQTVTLGIHLLDVLKRLSGDRWEWSGNGRGRFFLDLLLGSDRPRQQLDTGASVAEITADWPDDVAAFAERRRPYLLYE